MKKLFFFQVISGRNEYYVSNSSYLSKNYDSKKEITTSPAINWYEAKYYDYRGENEVKDLKMFFDSGRFLFIPLKTFKSDAPDDVYVAFSDKLYDTKNSVTVKNIEQEHVNGADPNVYYLKGKPYPVLTNPDAWPEPAECRKFLMETAKKFRVQAGDVMRKVFGANPTATSLQKAGFCQRLSASIPCIVFLLVKGLGTNPDGITKENIFENYLGLDTTLEENRQHALDADLLLGFPPGTLIPESYVV